MLVVLGKGVDVLLADVVVGKMELRMCWQGK